MILFKEHQVLVEVNETHVHEFQQVGLQHLVVVVSRHLLDVHDSSSVCLVQLGNTHLWGICFVNVQFLHHFFGLLLDQHI